MDVVINQIFENVEGAFHNPGIGVSVIAAVLIMVLFLAVYEFFVYRVVSHRSLYNKSFHISISVLPFFISTIVLCLQSNIVITLGTIGALAIIRFRTAIKDPVDMIYLLWSIHTGIACGCQLYEVSILTSAVVTLVLLVFENISFGRKPYLLVCQCDKKEREGIIKILSQYTKKYRIKSRNYTKDGLNLVIEFAAKNVDLLMEKLAECGTVQFSIIEYDNEDII